MAREEPFYMRFVRRSQERKRERETAIKDNISSGLRSSIGYKILLRMGWETDSGLGLKKDGRVSLTGLIQSTKRLKTQKPTQEIDYLQVESEYNTLLKESSTNLRRKFN
ncbi:hypothetical protein NEOKW01_0665 [Nematocida sp. AWRm80]|nr:hypothetical protein NEOKW01_0665 [Nematocida sp. AWRm80]